MTSCSVIGMESNKPAPANPSRSSVFESDLNINPLFLRTIVLLGYE